MSPIVAVLALAISSAARSETLLTTDGSGSLNSVTDPAGPSSVQPGVSAMSPLWRMGG